MIEVAIPKNILRKMVGSKRFKKMKKMKKKQYVFKTTP